MSGIVSVSCGMRVGSVRVPIVSCVRLYTCMLCVLYVSIVPCVVYVSCGGLFYCSGLFYLRVWVEYCPSNAQCASSERFLSCNLP